MEGFLLAHTQSQKSAILTSFLPNQNSPDIGAILIPPIDLRLKKMISLNSMLGMLPVRFGTQNTDVRPDVEWQEHCIFLVSFALFCRFTCLPCFLRNKFSSVLQTFDCVLMCEIKCVHCLSYCMRKGFEAIFMSRGYSDGLVFSCTKIGPA